MANGMKNMSSFDYIVGRVDQAIVLLICVSQNIRSDIFRSNFGFT